MSLHTVLIHLHFFFFLQFTGWIVAINKFFFFACIDLKFHPYFVSLIVE